MRKLVISDVVFLKILDFNKRLRDRKGYIYVA